MLNVNWVCFVSLIPYWVDFSTLAILLLGLGCFLSLNQVHGAPADGDDAEEAEEEAGEEEGGEGEDGGEATEDDHCSCGSVQINSSQPKSTQHSTLAFVLPKTGMFFHDSL